MRLALAIVAVIVAVGMPTGGASAQSGENSLQSQEPEDGATLGASPTQLIFVFNQEIRDDDLFTARLACDSQPQATGEAAVDDEGLIVTVPVTAQLPRGACVLDWDLKDVDAELIASGFSTFSVTADPVATTAAGVSVAPSATSAVAASTPDVASTRAEDGSSGGAEWLGRLLSTIGILVVFGGLVLIAVGWPEGPEYVVTVRFLRATWMLALIGTIVYLIAFAADFNDTSLGAAMSPGAWFDLADAGWPGRGALARLVLVAATGWVAMRPERIIDPTTQMAAFGIPALAVIAVGLSRVTGSAAFLGFFVNAVHALGAAVWIGGVAMVARVVLAGPGEDDLVQATRAFSRISIPAILVTIVTGIIQMIRLVGGNLFSSGHGQVLLLKVIAVAATLAVALAVRQQVTMRLERAHELTVPLADRFRRAFGAEAALGVVVLAFSGWMLALTPAKGDSLGDGSYAIELPFVDQTTGLDATVFIDPAQVGLNGFKIEVEAPAEGITNLVLRFIPPVGAGGMIVEQQIPLTTAGTAVLDEEIGLPFQVAGTWQLELSASTALGVQPGAIQTFLVTDADGNVVTVPPAQGSSPGVATVIIDQSTTVAPLATAPPVVTTAPPSTTGG